VTYGAAFIYGFGKIGVGAEAGGDKDGPRFWLCGARYSISEGVAVDGAFSGGFEDDSGNKATTGLHYEF
jgi:hypothetical protein